MSDALYPYQRDAVNHMVRLEGRGCLFLDVGTGKTWTALETARQLVAARIVVVCPIAVAPVWEREVAARMPKMLFVDGTIGKIADRAIRIREHMDRRPIIVAVGYESYWREPLRTALLDFNADLIIYDEAHRLKRRGTKQARFAHIMRNHVKHVLALTATPMPKGPEDLFSIYKAVRSDVFGDRWASFEDKYIRITNRPGFPLITGYKNQPDMRRRVAATAFRIKKIDALDLPEEVDVSIPLELSPKTRKMYDTLKKQAIVEVEGLAGDKGIVLSRVVVTNLLRLMQMTSGFAKTDDGREIDIGTEKLDVVRDLLADLLPRRVVIFCKFTRDIRRTIELVTSMGHEAFELSGRIEQQRRRRSIAEFQASDSAVLVCQVQVSALGIDLSCADVAIFFSADYDLMNYIQSRGRLHRHGQVNKVTHYLLAARKTVDEQIYAALAKKENLAASILDVKTARKLFGG